MRRFTQLAVEIEDGTAVVRVRLSEQITRRLFGVEAREFKKIYQKNEDHASRIQVGCRCSLSAFGYSIEVRVQSTYVLRQLTFIPGTSIWNPLRGSGFSCLFRSTEPWAVSCCKILKGELWTVPACWGH